MELLDAPALRRLELRLEEALRRARRAGVPALVSVTTVAATAIDPTAAAAAARRPGEPWFCLEQPDRDGWALAGLGAVRRLEAKGDDRFKAVSRRWRALCSSALTDGSDGPAGSGLVALGGFAFAADGGGSKLWDGFAPASLVVPEVSLARRGDRASVTVNVEAAPDDTLEDLIAHTWRRIEELHSASLPLLDPGC